MIQGSINQLLSMAAVGVRFLPSTEMKAQERAQIKKENRLAEVYSRDIADYEETHKNLSPEELPQKGEKEREKVEEAAKGLYDIERARYIRKPSQENWEAQYLSGTSLDEIRRQGGTSGYINKLSENTKKTAQTKLNEEQDRIRSSREATRQWAENKTDPFSVGLWRDNR